MPAGWVDQLLKALQADDLGTAEAAMCQATPRPEVAELGRLAQGMVRRKRWAHAAWILSQIAPAALSEAYRLELNLCRNFADLAKHRPELHAQLADLTPDGRYRIGGPAGRPPSILARRDDGSFISLSPQNNPEEGVAQCLAQLDAVLARGESLALCGIGDGYFLLALARKPRRLFMTMQQPVMVIEPDPHALRAALALHDLSGPNGPIQQARFRWFVGGDWSARFADMLRDEPMAGCPSATVCQSLNGREIQETLSRFLKQIGERDDEMTRAVEAYYADPRDLSALLASDAPRKPRVLLLTTRFSTVLQYAAADAARGFEQAGWEARILIEPNDHCRLYRPAIRRALHDFKPDAFFQIDHLRHEHDGLFPTNLPFICWMQDHLPNLHDRRAAAAVGPTDFLLTDAPSTYVHGFGYPARQFIPVAKLTRVMPQAYVAPAVPGDEIVFVSNASHTPRQLMEQLERCSPRGERETAFALECGRRVVARYSMGATLATYVEICELIRQVGDEAGVRFDEAGFRALARNLTHPFNDALYRQQALRWTAAAAEELGVTIGLYGAGWESNEEFARYARGPIENGPALHQLTRRTPINLQIVPYLCLHQRLLDGVMAGGFFLVRRHPADWAPRALLDLMETSYSSRDAHELRAELVRLSKAALCSLGSENLNEMLHDWERAELLVRGEEVLPDLEQVSFDNASGLRERIQRFMSDEPLRRGIVARQSASVEKRFGYAQTMVRIGHTMAGLLRGHTTQSIREAA